MPVAMRSVFSAGVALAGAGVIAVSPIAPPAPGVQLAQIKAPAIELLDSSTPAFGANIYQVLVNQLGNFLALEPILLGSKEQCTVCLGPAPGINPVPFTGWGAIGIATGLIQSVPAFIGSLQDGNGLLESLGVAGLAVQTPITNTLLLIDADRQPDGGFDLGDTMGRALTATLFLVEGLTSLAAEAVIAAPIALVEGAVHGLQAFAGTLATTGNFVAALQAGLQPLVGSITGFVGDVVSDVAELRTSVYSTLTADPQAATHPIPILEPQPTMAAPSAAKSAAAPTLAAAAEDSAANSPKKVVDSFKAEPTTEAGANDSTSNDTAAGDNDSKGSTEKATAGGKSGKHGVGGSKRQRAQSND